MSTADKLALLLTTKEAQRVKLGLAKSVPFSAYIDYMKKVDPKLSANFVTNTYAKSGVASTFADAFTFNRAGKAWLVRDTGLQEYAVDVPRFDNGLLIEQSATNLIKDSVQKNGILGFTPKSGGLTTTSSALGVGAAVEFLVSTSDLYAYKVTTGEQATSILSFFVSNLSNTSTIGFGKDTTKNISCVGASAGVYDATNVTSVLRRITLTSSNTGTSKGLVRYKEQNTGGTINLHAMQLTASNSASSLIVTDASPVTRPADFLSCTTTGTTITGDWDSTLTLSIVDGQIVHSGYGRIRTLEIN